MSAHTVLRCDGPNCPAVSPGSVTGDGTTAEVNGLRRTQAAHGWIRIQFRPSEPRRDLCPKCATAARLVLERRAQRFAPSSKQGYPA